MPTEPRHVRPQRLVDYLGTRRVFNDSGTKIDSGMVVRVVGINTAEAYFLVAAALADNSEEGPLYTAEEDIEAGLSGRVRKQAVLTLDTSAGSQQDPVYLSASVAGSITLTLTGEQVGWVGTVSATGACLIDPASNAGAGGAHAAGDGSDHADVATNTTHITSDGSAHADVATNTLKVSASIDQLFQQKSSFQWGESYPGYPLTPSTGGLFKYTGFGGVGTFPKGKGGGADTDGKYLIGGIDIPGGEAEAGWAAAAPGGEGGLTSGRQLPRLCLKGSVESLLTCKHFIGLSVEDPDTVMVAADDPTATYIGFQFSSARGDTTWQLVHNINGGTQTIVDTLITASAGAVLYFEFEYLTASSVKFSIKSSTYTTTLYTLTTTVQPASSVEWLFAMLNSKWTGTGTIDINHWHSSVLVSKNLSAVT
jgi:hypothetical protein